MHESLKQTFAFVLHAEHLHDFLLDDVFLHLVAVWLMQEQYPQFMVDAGILRVPADPCRGGGTGRCLCVGPDEMPEQVCLHVVEGIAERREVILACLDEMLPEDALVYGFQFLVGKTVDGLAVFDELDDGKYQCGLGDDARMHLGVAALAHLADEAAIIFKGFIVVEESEVLVHP